VVTKLTSIAAIAAAVLIVGCGSSKKVTKTVTRAATPANTSAPTATAEDRPEVPADHAIASGSLLRLTDFPTGWEQHNQSGGNSSLSCPSIEVARGSLSGRDTSPQFAKGSDEFVDASVYVYRSIAAAQAAFAHLSGTAARLCMGKAIGSELARAAASKQGAKVTFGQPSTGELSIPAVGDQAAAGRIAVPYTVVGRNLRAVVDLVLIRVDRGIQNLSFIGSADAFDRALESTLTQTAVNRLAGQLHAPATGATNTAGATTTAPSPTHTTTSTTRSTTSTETATTPTTHATETTPSTTPTTHTSTQPSGSQPSPSAVAKAKQLLSVCRREQPHITLQELEREAATPLGIQC
jgi:hypothetical protein